MRNGEDEQLIYMTHGHELRGWGNAREGALCRAEGNQGEKKNGTTVIA